MSQIDYDAISEIYDIYVVANHDVAFFRDEATGTNGRVLELTAGTGRLSLPLLEAGVRLTCVDRSPRMLDVLRRKADRRGLQADVHCADVCRLDLRERFELAILPFQAFMEFVGEQSQRAALSAVFRHLSPGGRFFCTLHNPAVRRAHVDGVLRLVGRYPAPDGTLVVSGVEHGGEPVVTRLQYFELFGADGLLVWKRLLPMEFELIEPDAFEALARGAGFRIVDLFGDYDRTPFDSRRSATMIWILERGRTPRKDGAQAVAEP